VSSEFDLLGARVRLANEQPELLRARNNQELATETFRRLLNLGEEPFDVQGELALEPVRVVPERLQTLARSRRPALRALESLVLLRDRDVTATRARMFPSLKAHAAYSGANSYGFAAFSGEWEWHWSAGASLTWDVWDGDLARAQVAEKKLLRAKAETDLEELQRAVRLQVLEACLDLKRAAETALSGEDSVALAGAGDCQGALRVRAGHAPGVHGCEPGAEHGPAGVVPGGARPRARPGAARVCLRDAPGGVRGGGGGE
jgi:outer membrane protein TolC